MHIIGIYAKQYDCSKCDGKINYGQASKDGKTPVTKDKKPFNNKYGKESNILSVAVNAGTSEIHQCYAAYAVKDFDELTGAIQAGPTLDGMSNSEVPGYDIFIDTVKSLYVKLNYEAGKLCGEGAMAKDKHITTMGLIHDYFSFRNLK